jgi:hypothetical protein
MDFPTADQARNNINQINNEAFNILISSIKKAILNSNKSNINYSLNSSQYCNDELIKNILTFLREKGYTVEIVYSSCQWDYQLPYIKIEW